MRAAPADFTDPHHWYLLYHLVAYTGLRRGEAVGLRWADVNLAGSAMTIAQQIVQYAWATETSAPKTDSGEREVALDEATCSLIAAHRLEAKRSRLAHGPGWIDTGLVFTQADGSPLEPDKVTDHFMRLAKDAALPPIRLHDLRHGAATHALSAGVDVKVVSEMLGHSTSALTRDTYTSVVRETQYAAAEAIAEVIGRNRRRAA